LEEEKRSVILPRQVHETGLTLLLRGGKKRNESPFLIEMTAFTFGQRCVEGARVHGSPRWTICFIVNGYWREKEKKREQLSVPLIW